MGGRSRTVLVVLVVALVVGGLVAAFRPWDDRGDGPETVASPRRSGGPVTVLAAGDIAMCNRENDEATAKLIESEPDATVLALGDLAYPDGSAEDFAECFDPSWGSFATRIRPVPGNHEYRTDGAQPYFDYFGSSAGEPGKGWYSFALGDWHAVALNSNCDDVGCDEGSPQETWLRADLEQHSERCTLAYWHEPPFSSGVRHGGTKSVEDLWQALVDYDVDILLASHEHLYERTAPLDADGAVDPEQGVRLFVVGTGGGELYELGERIPGSEAAINDTHGVLKLTLRSGGYDWEFVPTSAGGSTDSGSADCR